MSPNRIQYPMSKSTATRMLLNVNSTGAVVFHRTTTRFAFTLLLAIAATISQPSRQAFAQDTTGTPSDASKPESERLPPGYEAPPEKLAIMELDRPLLSKEELAKLKKDAWNSFNRIRTECDLSANGKRIIEGSIRFRLAEMTVKEDQSKLLRLHQQFVGELTTVGGVGKKASEIQDMTKALGQELVKQVPNVLKNNFYARLHATEILGEINYAPAYDVLIGIMQAKDITEDEENGQPEAVKIAAVSSLTRILRFANPTPKERLAIAFALVAELRKPDAFWWRQQRMIDALRYCNIPGIDQGNNDQPFVVEALVAIVKDNQRAWIVRTRACYALGRVPFPKTVRVDDVITAICECALEMCAAANANPRDLNWKRCFANLYFAFQPANGKDKDKDKDLNTELQGPGGLLTRNSGASKKAYEVLIPIFNDVRIASTDIHIAKPPAPENEKKLSDFVRARNGGQAKND